MEKSHEPNPERVGETFHVLALIPDQTIPMYQVPGVAHGDHGVIEQNVVLFTLDIKTACLDVEIGIIHEAEQDQAKEKIPEKSKIHLLNYKLKCAIIAPCV